MATDRKVEILERIRRAVVFLGRVQLDPSGAFWGRWCTFPALKAGKGVPRARWLKPQPQQRPVTN
jgi:hypothetical protein